MSDFLLTLAITFVVFTAIAMLINYCRRRLRKTPHGLTGMCHHEGGRMCERCGDSMRDKDR